MVTKQQLQQMLDETIEELEKPNAAMSQRFRQLIFHRANLEMHLRDLEKPKPEPKNDYFFTAQEEPTGAIHRQSWSDWEEELFS